MTAINMTLCILCFERVLGCSECNECDANRYCPGHYFLRAQKQGRLHAEGTLFAVINKTHDEKEFVRLFNRARSMGLLETL